MCLIHSYTHESFPSPLSESILLAKFILESIPHLLEPTHNNGISKSTLCKEKNTFWSVHGYFLSHVIPSWEFPVTVSLSNMDYHGVHNPTECFLLNGIIIILILTMSLPGIPIRQSAVMNFLAEKPLKELQHTLLFPWFFCMSALLCALWLVDWGQIEETNGQNVVTELNNTWPSNVPQTEEWW